MPMTFARKTWMIVRMPDVIHAAEIMYSRASHMAESRCQGKHASPAMSRPPDVAMPATMASACWKPMESATTSGRRSSLDRNLGGGTPPLVQGIDGMQRYL